ncbi:substrate-binding domain-containing protein [Labrys okinawensis]|uniref:vWA domain-containing protein n=1 Tax=Labrys okinawensis TaxID=346911 RepID=UPI0039BCD368
MRVLGIGGRVFRPASSTLFPQRLSKQAGLKIRPPVAALLLLLFLPLLALAACSKSGPEINIVAGSENQPFEPLVQEFCKSEGAKCTFKYEGSLDIGFGLKSTSDPLQADVVWPAASIWIDVFDESRKVKHLQSISQSPVLLGVRKAKAEALGWTKRDVTTADILQAVKDGKLKFLMSSATQSNSGAGVYLAMLNAAVGRGDVLTEADLADPTVRDKARTLLSGVQRSSGSSGWLSNLFLDMDARGEQADAMWNYEVTLKETNEALVKRGSDPLWLIYPKDGVAISDGPMGYLDRGRGADVETFVTGLEKFLLSADAQKRIAAIGRRVGPGSGAVATPVPEWNLDTSRAVTALRPPDPKVIFNALNLYQEALRRPSLTALCLDISGSMQGPGISQLHDAMSFLFTPEQTRNLLVQWTPDDHIVAIPFSSGAGDPQTGTGAPADQKRLKQWGNSLEADGGTDMYACVEAALQTMTPDLDSGKYLPAILIMTDGRSEGDLEGFIAQWKSRGRGIPIFGVTFGDADTAQLDRLATATGGRVFDGRSSLAEAFRAARGYN